MRNTIPAQMKRLRVLPLLLAGSLCVTSTVSAIGLGASRAEVVEELGVPSGEILTPHGAVLLFPRGHVRLKEDKVVAKSLISEAALRARQDELEARQEAVRLRREARQERLAEEGQALLVSTLQDPFFHELPPPDQVAFWRRFSARYPSVSVTEHLHEAYRRAQVIRQEQAAEERLRAMETRLAQAERRSAYRSFPLGYGFPWRYDPHFHRPHKKPRPAPRAPLELSPRAEILKELNESRREVYRGLNFNRLED